VKRQGGGFAGAKLDDGPGWRRFAIPASPALVNHPSVRRIPEPFDANGQPPPVAPHRLLRPVIAHPGCPTFHPV
jgi:hypothetical protein